MQKKGNLIQIEKIPLNKPSYNIDDDNEIELKPNEPPTPPVAPASIAPPITKKKINISDEERERRRNMMLKNREVKMENAKIRKAQEEEFLKLRQKELDTRIYRKMELMRKKEERERLHELMYEEVNRKTVLDDDYDEEDNKPAPRLKARTPKPKPVIQQQKPEPQYQEVYQQQYPAFRWI